MEISTSINYKLIYTDLISKKFPEKQSDFQRILSKKSLNEFDVLQISRQLSSGDEADLYNGKHKSYCKNTILKILDFQKKNCLNNSELANHFNLSRNTVARWKKIFQV